MVKRIYIAGKITGLKYDTAYRAFAEAEEHFLKLGYKVVNPMRLCRPEWSWFRCMAKCLVTLPFCNYIHLLPSWSDSRGARIERRVARFFRKPQIHKI